MNRVDVTEGLKYGSKLMGYYIGVAVVGSILSAIGTGMALFEILKMALSVAFTFIPSGVESMAPVGASQVGPNIGLLIFAFLILIIGVLLILVGVFGSLYKLIADAVAEGRRMSRQEMDERDGGERDSEDVESGVEPGNDDSNTEKTDTGGTNEDDTVTDDENKEPT